ncbi:MAG: alkaline shock response membrane anchor protein AmaP [Candidatus Omnitrophota bacterium]
MRGVTNLSFFLYTIVIMVVGILLLGLAFELIPNTSVSGWLDYVYQSKNMRLIVGLIGIVLIAVGLGLIQFVWGKIQRERTIAFSNPDGQVTISLSAIEDFIKKVARQIPEVKDLRPDVLATKKGLDIFARATLFTDVNIPDTTEKIQSTIKARIMDIIGIEEAVNVKVHVVKIVQKEEHSHKSQETIPYRGIEYK